MKNRLPRHVALVGLVAMVGALWGGNLAPGMDIGPGFDFLQTLSSSPAVLDLSTIDPGVGNVSFKGLPIGPGMTDTIIQRYTGLPSGGTGIIDAEVKALSLVTVSPVTMKYPTDLNPVSYNLYLRLNPLAPVGGNAGTVDVTEHHDTSLTDAGKFDSQFNLDVNLTFENAVTGVFQPPLNHIDSLQSSGATFAHVPPPNYPQPWMAGKFFPGVIVHQGPHPVTFPAVVEGEPEPDPQLPPLCTPDWPEGYATSLIQEAHARWVVHPETMVIDLGPNGRHCPVEIQQVTAVGADQVEVFDSTLTGSFVITNPAEGTEYTSDEVVLTGPVETLVRGRAEREHGTFATEIVSMSLSGYVPVPDGSGGMTSLFVELNQDPDRPSLGQTIVTKTTPPPLVVELDEGTTLEASDLATTVAKSRDPFASDQEINLPGGVSLRRFRHPILYVEPFIDPVGPYVAQDRLETELETTLVLPTGEVLPVQLKGDTYTGTYEPESEEPHTFGVEIYEMNLEGTVEIPGSSPVGVKIRLDPSRVSSGKTTLTDTQLGPEGLTQYEVDSFFDVFFEVSVGGGDYMPVPEPVFMELGAGDDEYLVDSFFDVFTTLSLGGGQPVPQQEAARMTLGGERRPGDTNDDGYTTVSDLLNSFTGFSGPQGDTQDTVVNRYPQDGDNDGDRDVDVGDLLKSFSSFTGPPEEGEGLAADICCGGGGELADEVAIGELLAGNTTDSATRGDLIYDYLTGNVKLDPSESPGGAIIGFVLKNAVGGNDFTAPGMATFPAGGVTTDTTTEISWANLPPGFSSTHNMGNIFPTGYMTAASLAGWLTTADANGTPLGTATYQLDLIVVPEPGTLILLGMGVVCLLGYCRRRRRAA